MKERGIIMQGDSVRAIIAGNKKQSRRVVKNVPDWAQELGFTAFTPPGKISVRGLHPEYGPAEKFLPLVYGVSGDRLWVRESFEEFEAINGMHAGFGYQADLDQCGQVLVGNCARTPRGFTSPRYMPRKASRILLELTGVRAERLQSISDSDAYEEGVLEYDGALNDAALHRRAKEMGETATDPRVWFAEIWDLINRKRPGCSWADNPFVWALSFRRIS